MDDIADRGRPDGGDGTSSGGRRVPNAPPSQRPVHRHRRLARLGGLPEDQLPGQDAASRPARRPRAGLHPELLPGARLQRSRAALLSGLRPSTTGVYENNVDWRRVVPAEAPTLPLYFKQSGYYCAGAGKIFHGGFRRDSDWDDYFFGKNRPTSGSSRERAEAKRLSRNVAQPPPAVLGRCAQPRAAVPHVGLASLRRFLRPVAGEGQGVRAACTLQLPSPASGEGQG